jgi:hypothetical protein
LSSQVEPEQVADVFVRINSQGKNLNQADFILTLMSVFWDEGRSQLEDFSRRARTPSTGGASPYNPLFHPMPDQLLRVAVAVGFRRARLSAVYAILRGKNADGGELTVSQEQHFESLRNGVSAALKVQFWHDFLNCVILAGYRTPNDLAQLRNVKSPDDFHGIINDVCASTLTNDFWSITLPGDLATSAARSPSMFAFFAALNVLDARTLYSDHNVRDLMNPAIHGTKSSLERHHLFPIAYLKAQGISDQRDYNQIANFAIVEWGDNVAISATPPCEYVPVLEARFENKVLEAMYRHHALPPGWHNMSYDVFLKERRSRIAQTIREGYEILAGKTAAQPSAISVSELIATGETGAIEFKATLRTNLHTGEKDPRMELAVLKSVAGFLNAKGGTLIIGVADDGAPVGLEKDGFLDDLPFGTSAHSKSYTSR